MLTDFVSGHLWIGSLGEGGSGVPLYQIDIGLRPWLKLNMRAGVIPGGGSQKLMVEIDASNLAPGVYEATILITTTDDSIPQFRVPVELTVTAGGDGQPPVVSVKTAVLRGQASPNAVSVQVEGKEVLDPKTGIWSAAVDVPPVGKTVEATGRDAEGQTRTLRIRVGP
jgi:hypothetical protein